MIMTFDCNIITASSIIMTLLFLEHNSQDDDDDVDVDGTLINLSCQR